MSDDEHDEIWMVGEPGDPAEAIHTFQDTMERFIETADVNRVYGAPIRRGDVTIIPAAEVIAGLGFGLGFGSGVSPEDVPEGEVRIPTGGGGGGGGGGRTFTRPVAVVVIGPEGVRVEPVVDQTKIALAALTAAGFIFTTLLRMRSGRITED